MPRPATRTVAAFVGLLLAGCAGGGFGQPGVSLPTAGSDGVQTVSDAADALDAHRSTGSDSAKSAIGVTDAMGAFVRDIAQGERALNATRGAKTPGTKILRTFNRFTARSGRQIVAGSDLVLQASLGNVSDFCHSSAGFTVSGIPSLDITFGWQSGAFSGGSRVSGARGATWSANASGSIAQGAIGALSIRRAAGGASCPMAAPAYTLDGADVTDSFSLPIIVTFHGGQITNISVTNGKFADGESLDVTTVSGRGGLQIDGTIRDGRAQLASFHTDGIGNGTLTITSTGAQYAIGNWIVVSI
jgi:hypothetical protein